MVCWFVELPSPVRLLNTSRGFERFLPLVILKKMLGIQQFSLPATTVNKRHGLCTTYNTRMPLRLSASPYGELSAKPHKHCSERLCGPL